MKLAINPATTMPGSFEQDVTAYGAAGFEAMEIWLGKVDAYLEKGNSLEDASKLMADNGLAPAGACFSGLQFSGDADEQKSLDAFKGRLEMCQALGASVLVVIPGVPGAPTPEEAYERVAEGMARAGEIAEPCGVALAIEFIKGSALIGCPRTAADVARRSGRDNVGVLFDTFHFYAGVSKLADIPYMKKEELLLVHLNDCRDVPREMMTDQMRVFPGEGVFPLKDILGALAALGYEGYASLELFNQQVWDMGVAEAAKLSFEKANAFMQGL